MNITENSDDSRYNNSGYYLTPDLSQRLDLISHLLANTQRIPYVQAAEGCGKTRLTQHLAELLAERYSVFLIEGESALSAKALRSQLAQETGAAAHEVIDDEQLASQVKALHEQNKTLLFLVDDAEQLPAETLSWLAEIITGQQETFISKCVIFAAVDVLALPLSPVLLATLNDSIQTLDIPPITLDQLPGFVASIDPLKSAVIDESQYAALMKNSAGIIGKILWQLQYLDNSPIPQQELETPSSNKMKPLYVVAGILFVSAMVSLIIFQDEINLSVNESKPEAEGNELEVISLPVPPPVVAVPMDVVPVDVVKENQEKPPQQIDTAQLADTLSEADSDKTQISDADTEPTEITDPVPPVLPAPLENPEKQAQTEQQQTNHDTVVATLEKVANETLPEEDSVEDNELRLEPEITTQPATNLEQTKKPAVVSPETAVSVKEPPKPQQPKPQQPEEQALIQPVEWMLNQPAKSYTLQLLAVSDEKGIKRFIKQHSFSGNLVILKTKRNGKPWYALLYEAYASRDEALNARKNLPKSYKSSSAWPRSILSIRQAIDAN